MTEYEENVASPHVVIAGAGFAGLAAAYTTRRRLGQAGTVTVVSPSPHFVFAPSLIWTPFGRPLEQSLLDIAPSLADHGIRFIQSAVRQVNVRQSLIEVEEGEIEYDRLIVATGGRPDTRMIPGLAGEFREAAWVVGEDSAMDLRDVLRRLIENPGPLLVGVAQGASFVSAAYELVLQIDTELRNKGVRSRTPITFVTAEPTLGELYFGQTAAEPILREIFSERDIAYRTGIAIAKVGRHEVTVGASENLAVEAALIMPPLTGAVDVWKSSGLTDESGLIPVNRSYQHVSLAGVYAAGVASYFYHPVSPLGRQRAPHTGYLSMRMGANAAENVAASMGYGEPARRPLPELLDIRVLDGGEAGLLISSRGTTELHHTARRLSGPVAHRAKRSIERHLLWRLRTGRVSSLVVPSLQSSESPA